MMFGRMRNGEQSISMYVVSRRTIPFTKNDALALLINGGNLQMMTGFSKQFFVVASVGSL